ncbi:GntR family transcriptional regulator [Thalassospira lucentensis]|uniref:GntR family transcriptional regulator n=1 Tax=Thalassospira lucentensis TaxID=168935 RepID=A0A358HXP4_9PROT|nr:GntR family transcriptional regulator [Thalassospira lucentensis]HBU99950.1 GntR family transcriptional regulator [Thalassospira lucentensis]HCW67003.1 GntR family transcriptional regulator [Thalassospira lucentensis]
MKSQSPNTRQADKIGSKIYQKIKRGSASAQLHGSLRERIIQLELEPGQNVSRGEIASEYGVSQTPVRDALLKLEEEGLIDTFPQSKTEVSKINIEHALETQFLRLSLELEITRRLSQSGDPALIGPAQSILAQQSAAMTTNDLAAFARLDRDFHSSLFDAAGVSDLYGVVQARSGHIDRLRKLNLPDPGKLTSILDCHTRLLDAIRASNAKETENVVREHLSGTLAKINDIRERHRNFF